MAGGHLAADPDGGLLVGDGQAARLPSGRLTRRDLVQGDHVGSLAFDAAGSLLATDDLAGRVTLWDGELRRRVGGPRNTFPAPLGDTPEAVTALAFSPDGTTLYAGSPHVPLQRYVIDPDRAVTELCARAGTGLTRAQWQTYVPDAPYRRLCD
ncbi:WD40 repeat domain-containing protein [Streptomyces sp. 4F14]|uniref:WD40 repeat domain-containing protein n=1 Tax=Streptomyces sp. 4F14 TaxID=3394380 RepID=UPI003A83F3EB